MIHEETSKEVANFPEVSLIGNTLFTIKTIGKTENAVDTDLKVIAE